MRRRGGDFDNFSVCSFIFSLVLLVRSESDLHRDCLMRLGQYGQGFDIQCEGGAEQISLFNRYLRQQVLLPTLIKMALKTDLCSISQQLEKYGKIFGFKKQHRQQRSNQVTVFENHRKSLIQHLHFEWTKVHFKRQKVCGQIVLPDRSILIRQKLSESTKMRHIG